MRFALRAFILTSPILAAVAIYVTLHWMHRPRLYLLADALIVFQVLVYGALFGSEAQRLSDRERERKRTARTPRTTHGEDEIDRLTTPVNGVVDH